MYEQEQQENLRKKPQEGVGDLLESTDDLLGKIDDVLKEDKEVDLEASEASYEPEQNEPDQKESAKKRGFFGEIWRKSREAGQWVSETAREGAEGAKKIASALRQNSELRKEIAKKLEVGAERWLSLKGGGDILKAFVGKGDLASLVKGMFEKSGEIERAQTQVEGYGKIIEAHRKEFKDQVQMTRMERVLQLLGKSKEESAEITKQGYNEDVYRQYKQELEKTGTYIVWAQQGHENDDKLKETKARIESNHRADQEKAGVPRVLIENDNRNDVFREELKKRKEDIENITKEKRGKHTRVNRDQQPIVRRVLATIAAHSENRETETARVMKANVEGTVNAYDETRDIVNTFLTAIGRVELRAASGILTRIGKGAHEALKTRERDEITLDYEQEKSRLLAYQERYGSRIAKIQELRARVPQGAPLENEEFLSELMEFNRKYRQEAQSSLDDSDKPSYKKDKFIEFFKTNDDIEKYLKTAESQYANSLDKLRIAHKGILESKDGDDQELGRLWYLKKTICDKARTTARAFKIWENRFTLQQKQGAVRNIISAGQAFGDVFRFMRFGHDAEDLAENIIHGEVFGKEGGFMEYLKDGGEKLASRFYEDNLAHTLIDRNLHRSDLSDERREILASLLEKLHHGGEMTDEENNFLHTIESQAREMHHKELSGERLSDSERSAIAEAKHEAAEEYGAKGALEKIAMNLGEYNVARSASTVTELTDRLKRIVNITEQGTGSLIANLDRAGANIARRAYGNDLTALMFQKESVSGTRAILEDSRERLFHYFVGDLKRDELTQEDQKYLSEVEHNAAELSNKHRSGAELTDEETALIAAAEHKALIDYMDQGVFEKIAKSAGRIREALQGIPDPVLQKEAETQLALIETDPKQFAEGLRVCGAGMMGFGAYGNSPELRKRLKKGLSDEQGGALIKSLIAGSAVTVGLGILLVLAHEHDWLGVNELMDEWRGNRIETENDTLLRTKTSDNSNIVTINWHPSKRQELIVLPGISPPQKTLPNGEIAEKEVFVPKRNEYEHNEGNVSRCFVHPTKKDLTGIYLQRGYMDVSKKEGDQYHAISTESTDISKKMGELGMIVMDSFKDPRTNADYTIIRTGVGETTLPFSGDKCYFSKESAENNPILIIKTNNQKEIHIVFDMSDPDDIKARSMLDYTIKTTPTFIGNANVPIADLYKYFDAHGNFIAEPEKAAAVPETPQPKPEVSEEKPKYAIGEIPKPTGDPVSLADALIMYSHVDGAIEAEIKAQISEHFNSENDYLILYSGSKISSIIIEAAQEKADAISAKNAEGKYIDESDKPAREELANITKMIPRLQSVLKREGLTLDKVKGELEKAQTIDELEKFIAEHEQKVWEINVKRSQELGAAEKTVDEKNIGTQKTDLETLLGALSRSHPSLQSEFTTDIDTPEKVMKLSYVLDEFSAASKSVFSQEQAAELLSQVTPKTTEALHGLAIRVRELSLFENFVEGVQTSALAKPDSLTLPPHPTEEEIGGLRKRFATLDIGLHNIKIRNMFLDGKKERVLELKNERYTEPMMQEYAEQVYQKAEEAQEKMIAQQHEIAELLKSAKIISPPTETVTPPSSVPEGEPKLLSVEDINGPSTPLRDKFISQLSEGLQKDDIELVKTALNMCAPESMGAVWNIYRQKKDSVYDLAIFKNAARQTGRLTDELSKNISTEAMSAYHEFYQKDMQKGVGIQDLERWKAFSTEQGTLIESDTTSFTRSIDQDIESIKSAGYQSITEAQDRGVISKDESILNWPILAKGNEIAGERSFGGLLGKLMSSDTDAEIKTKILETLNRVGQIPDNRSDIERELVGVGIFIDQPPHGLISIKETDNGGLVLNLAKPEQEPPMPEQELINDLYSWCSPITTDSIVYPNEEKTAIFLNNVPDDQQWDLRILNQQGEIVRSVSDIGPARFDWDLKNTQGAIVPDGYYSVSLIYKDEHGHETQVPGTKVVAMDWAATLIDIEPDTHTLNELLAMDSSAINDSIVDIYDGAGGLVQERIAAVENLFSKHEVLQSFRDRRERLCAHDDNAPDRGARDLEWLVSKFPWHDTAKCEKFLHTLALEMFAMSRQGDNFGLLNYAYKTAGEVPRPIFFATPREAFFAAMYLEEELRYMSKEQRVSLITLMSGEGFRKTGEDFLLNHFFRHVLEQYELSIRIKEPLGDRWVPKYARSFTEPGENRAPIILVREKFDPAQSIGSPNRKLIQFKIDIGDDLATWRDIGVMGVHIPDDIKSREGFSEYSIASLSPDRVRFKDGVIEIIEEAPRADFEKKEDVKIEPQKHDGDGKTETEQKLEVAPKATSETALADIKDLGERTGLFDSFSHESNKQAWFESYLKEKPALVWEEKGIIYIAAKGSSEDMQFAIDKAKNDAIAYLARFITQNAGGDINKLSVEDEAARVVNQLPVRRSDNSYEGFVIMKYTPSR